MSKFKFARFMSGVAAAVVVYCFSMMIVCATSSTDEVNPSTPGSIPTMTNTSASTMVWGISDAQKIAIVYPQNPGLTQTSTPNYPTCPQGYSTDQTAWGPTYQIVNGNPACHGYSCPSCDVNNVWNGNCGESGICNGCIGGCDVAGDISSTLSCQSNCPYATCNQEVPTYNWSTTPTGPPAITCMTCIISGWVPSTRAQPAQTCP